MAKAKKKPEPVEEEPLASSVSTPAKPSLPQARPKFDIGRPFRYAFSFIGGTFNGTLDGMAKGGRRGMWLGVGVGLLAVMSGAYVGVGATMAMGWAAGLVGGALLGGTFGLVTGGARGMGVEARRNKYSDDLIERAAAKSAPETHVDYRDAHREYKHRSDYLLDRIFQQQRENNAETRMSFQEHVHHSRMALPHEQGY